MTNQENRNGFLTPSGNRWCAACGRAHGRSFICASFSSDIVGDLLLPYGVPGNGISQLLAPFVQRGRARGLR